MIQTLKTLSWRTRLWGVVCSAMALSACAQTAVAPAPAASSSAPASFAQASQAAASSARSGLLAYEGAYYSPCGEIFPGLHAIDTLVVRPLSATQATAVYRKELYSQPGCSLVSRLLSVEQPQGSWELVGPGIAAGVAVDKVKVHFVAGQIKARVLNAERVRQTDEAYFLLIGQDPVGIPLQRATTAETRLEIFRLAEGKLHLGDPSTKDDEGFPKTLSADEVLLRIDVPAAPPSSN